MTRRAILRLVGAAAVPTIRRGYCHGAEGESFSTRAHDIVRGTAVIDMMGLLTTDWPRVHRWRANREGLDPLDLDTIFASQVSLFHPAVRLPDGDSRASTERWLTDWARFADFHFDRFQVVRSRADWNAVREGHRTGILLGSQDSTHFHDLADVGRFAAIGQRVSQLTYNGKNRLGGGCALGRHDPGLSTFGVDVVSVMNRLGMIVDVSHCGPKTTMDAFEASTRSVLITHSNCAALTPGQRRCKSDDEIRRMAATGGVMGITAIRAFVSASRSVRFDHVLDHFDHVARLVGVEHVGIGSDAGVLGLQRNVAPGFGRADSMLRLTDGLLRRGYSAEDIRLILGGNFERVLTEHLAVSERVLTQIHSSTSVGG